MSKIAIKTSFDTYGERVFEYQEISYDEFIHTIDRLKEVMEDLQGVNDALSDED